MKNSEMVIDGYLGQDGYKKVFANATQANKAAARLRGDGLNAYAIQSNASMRFLVKIA